MAEKTPQAKADDKRRAGHIQCRLDPKTTEQLLHFQKSRGYNQNTAVGIIIRQFFGGTKHD